MSDSTGSNPASGFAFAAFYFLAGIAALVSSVHHRWRGTYCHGLPASPATHVAMILVFFVLAACSLGDAYGWTFILQHPVLLRFGSMTVVAVCFGFDFLKEYLPQARVAGDRRMLRVSAIALGVVSVLLGIWFMV